MVTSKMDMGGPYVNLNDNVQSIASVVIGGTSFAGVGFVGNDHRHLDYCQINNLMNLMLINPYIQQASSVRHYHHHHHELEESE